MYFSKVTAAASLLESSINGSKECGTQGSSLEGDSREHR
jgi:hypothetical protein